MNAAWPELPYPAWKDTRATLHMWLQIAGKIRIACGPHLNHFWEATFYLTPRGLSTGLISWPGGSGAFDIQFDFLADQCRIATSAGPSASLALRPQSVAAFEREFRDALRQLGIAVKIWPMPVEVPNPIRFDQDQVHASYDAEAVRRWWRAMIEIERVFGGFRAGFLGKSSPVHLFWGSLDLAVTRFSGRRAPERPGADRVTRDAYSHEVVSVGFWAGDDSFPEPAFYAYAAPEPAGFRAAAVRPAAAFYNTAVGEFLLRYDDVRRAPDPPALLLEFLQSTYAAAADRGGWDRAALEVVLPTPS